jgi:membrane associated rhomboid family serine protease
MLPIGGDRGDVPAVATYTLLALMAGAFAWQLVMGSEQQLFIPGVLAFVPGLLFGGAAPMAGPVIPPPATLVTYMFLHGGWLHLLSNLLFLWVFGPKVEESLGPGRFTVVFVVCGVCAALAQAWMDPASSIPLIGGSGGVSGVLGAYLVLHPRSEIHVLTPIVVYMDVVELPAFVVILAWFALQLVYANWTPPGAAGVAFIAHVGGFVAGALLAPLAAPGVFIARFRPAPR